MCKLALSFPAHRVLYASHALTLENGICFLFVL